MKLPSAHCKAFSPFRFKEKVTTTAIMKEEEQTQAYNTPLITRHEHANPLFKGFEPIQGGCNLTNLISFLLKKPLAIIHDIETQRKPGRIIFSLIMVSAACLLVFGFVVGTFSSDKIDDTQLWAAPLKIFGGMILSSLLCLPSLYIFSCLAGVQARFQTIAGLLCSLVALCGLLLIGLTPVVWLFSASSNSASFLGGLLIMLWTVCVGFGCALVMRAGRVLGMKNLSHIIIWCVVFLVVTLQMTTTLRPIVGKDERLLNFGEKKFFLQHWGEQVFQDLRSEKSPRFQ